jgi:hypothetical protein
MRLDIRKKIIGIITLSLCISISIAIAAGNTSAAAKPVEISVIGGNEGRGGKHKGYFEATYSGKKIKVIYSYKANRANPMEHPIKVYQGDKKIADWECYLQQGNNQNLAIKDREITLIGKWQDQKTFEAYKIYLPADIRKIGEK